MTPIPMQIKKTKGTREKYGKVICVCLWREMEMQLSVVCLRYGENPWHQVGKEKREGEC